jgi:CheY-like chemotaxis protein
MSEASLPLNAEVFAKWVHDALNRLYDSPYLLTHPLAKLLANTESGTLQSTQNLRRLLLKTIREMRPQPGTPAQSSDWRAYRILELRYIEGLSPAEVMDQLSLGRSQYFRDQARIVEALAADLWNQWQQSESGAGKAENGTDTPRDALAHSEVERLYAEATWKAIDVGELINDLRTILDSLAKAKGASIRYRFSHTPMNLYVDRVMLRQSLLNVITYALDMIRQGEVNISSFMEPGEIGINIIAQSTAYATLPSTPELRQGVGLHISEEFIVAMGGNLKVEVKSGNQWAARLAWPAISAPVLLVVDDNEGFATLCRRYLAAHNWQVLSATSGAEAWQVISEVRPTIILLDVMMPKQDGWELLIALKENNLAEDIPIIICSILNEPQLALTLGATAYLKKPLSQQALVQALLPWSQDGASLGPVP